MTSAIYSKVGSGTETTICGAIVYPAPELVIANEFTVPTPDIPNVAVAVDPTPTYTLLKSSHALILGGAEILIVGAVS